MGRFNILKKKIKKRIRRSSSITAPSSSLLSFGELPSFDLAALPTDLKHDVSSFLDVPDVLNMLEAVGSSPDDIGMSHCRTPVTEVKCPQNISVLTFEQLRHPLCLVAAILPHELDRPDSISFQTEWMDQGMGKQKGRLYVVAQKISDLGDNAAFSCDVVQSFNFKQGRLVYSSARVSHEMSNLVATFIPQPDEFYQIWCFVGDSKGDLIHFKEMNFHTLAYGRESIPHCQVLRYEVSYKEDEDTHMKRMSNRWMEYMFAKGPLENGWGTTTQRLG